MKCAKARAIATVLLVLSVICTGVRADFKPDNWKHVAPVNIPDPPAEARGLVEVSLSPEVLDAAQVDLDDVRIVNAFRREVACVLHRTHPLSKSVQWFQARLFNKTYVPGKSSSVTADFGGEFLKDAVRIRTKGRDFRRETLIESSSDQKQWQRVREGALLFRINRGGKVEFERDVITTPENNHRYMRITVFNGVDDKDRVRIEQVGTHRSKGQRKLETRTAPVPLGAGSVTHEEKKKETRIEFDLGFRNLPLSEISFDFSELNFFRRATLEGRNEKTTVIHYRREDNSPAERTVETPWQTVRSFVLFRYSAGIRKSDSSLSVTPRGTGYRYLRLRVHNGDNPPLTFRNAEAARFLQLVRYPYKPQQRYRLFFGNPRASRPAYDLPHYIERLKSEGVVSATLGTMSANPDYDDDRILPWSERHRVILWVALVGVVVVLAVLIGRQARSVKDKGREEETSDNPAG